MKNYLSIPLLVSMMMLFNIAESRAQEQDWANLKRFRQENEKVGAPKPDENRVVFMGNSITQGWKEQVPEFFASTGYINRGISGQTTPQMLLRFRQDVVALQPKVVMILAGTNDIAGNTGVSTLEMIMDNLVSMCEIARANRIRVVLCSVLPAAAFPWRKHIEPAEQIVDLNKMIKQYAQKNGITYCDYYSALVDENKGMKPEYARDGVHPTLAGYAVMQPIAEKAIARALKKRKK